MEALKKIKWDMIATSVMCTALGIISVCSAGTKKSRTIFAQLILYVIRLRVYLYISD